MPLDLDAFNAGRTKCADEIMLADLRARTDRGEDVVTVGMLRAIIAEAGRDLKMKDVRSILGVPDPKPTHRGQACSVGLYGLCAAVIYVMLSGLPQTGFGLENGLMISAFVAFVLYLAYSTGVAAGGQLWSRKARANRLPSFPIR